MSRRRPARKIEPLERLRRYKERAKQLMDNELSKTGFDYGFKLHADAMGETYKLEVTSKEPRPDLLAGLLAISRQFINDDEPIHQSKVFHILQQGLTDDYLKGQLTKAMKVWKQVMKTDGIQLIYNGKELSPLYVTDMWINDTVHSYIRDPEKEAMLKHMQPYERAIMRTKFFECLQNAGQIIRYFHFVIRKALDEGLLDTSKMT